MPLPEASKKLQAGSVPFIFEKNPLRHLQPRYDCRLPAFSEPALGMPDMRIIGKANG